jgi:hypothetical protein
MLVKLFETFREECSTCEEPEEVFMVGLFVSILELGVRNPKFDVGLDESNFLVEQGEVVYVVAKLAGKTEEETHS